MRLLSGEKTARNIGKGAHAGPEFCPPGVISRRRDLLPDLLLGTRMELWRRFSLLIILCNLFRTLNSPSSIGGRGHFSRELGFRILIPSR
jgi:hypothetical protein